MVVHLIDGTYEIFRHFYGLQHRGGSEGRRFGAVVGVLNTVLRMIADGATHIGVATDHVIESFRNELWSDYKTGDGVDRALLAQFTPLEDALASAAEIASKDARVEKIRIWTPDKDLSRRERCASEVWRRSGAHRRLPCPHR